MSALVYLLLRLSISLFGLNALGSSGKDLPWLPFCVYLLFRVSASPCLCCCVCCHACCGFCPMSHILFGAFAILYILWCIVSAVSFVGVVCWMNLPSPVCCLEYSLRHVCIVASAVGFVDIVSWIVLSWSPFVSCIRFSMSASMYRIYH